MRYCWTMLPFAGFVEKKRAEFIPHQYWVIAFVVTFLALIMPTCVVVDLLAPVKKYSFRSDEAVVPTANDYAAQVSVHGVVGVKVGSVVVVVVICAMKINLF